MKNRLTDLNDILFAQLERLNDEELPPEKLRNEIDRTKAITDVAQKVIDNATLQLEAFNVMHGGHGRNGAVGALTKLPRVIGLIAGTEAVSNGGGPET